MQVNKAKAIKKKTLLSWSSGKDSAWALHVLRQNPEINVAGLFSVLNERFRRVSMHAVRLELLEQQADAAGLPLEIIWIPDRSNEEQYSAAMRAFIDSVKERQIDCIAFGDLFLQSGLFNIGLCRSKLLVERLDIVFKSGFKLIE